MISKLDKVMENLEKEKELQADKPEDKTKEELVRIDEVMSAVRKVNINGNHSKLNNEMVFKFDISRVMCRCKRPPINRKWIRSLAF